jgi:PAS domain S-box-containing protein
MDDAFRPTGIEGVGDKPWGTHCCLFYETKDDLIDILIPYFKAGLENHEFCLCVASEPVIAAEAEHALKQAVPDFARSLAQGQIEIISHAHWYLQDGRFDPLRVRQGWADKLEQGLAQGYAGLRFAANASWLAREDWDRFAEYEEQVDEVFRNLPILAVCTYTLAGCSSADMLDVVRHHQFALTRRQGVWERLEGPELGRALAQIRRLNADLERRVEERTTQLTTANAQLQNEIAERRRVEEALSEREEFQRLLTENTGDFVRFFDPSGKLVYANPAVKRVLGAIPTDFPGFPHPEDVERCLEWFRHVLAGGKGFLQWRVRTKDGEWCWMETRGNVIPYRGTPHLLTMCRDITQSKQAEEAVRHNEELLQSVLTTLPVGVAVTDLAGDIVVVNAASKRIWDDIIVSGAERRTRSQGTWHDSGKKVEPETWASVRALREGRTTLNELLDIETFGGHKKTIQNSAAPIRNAEGAIQGAVIVNEDVTERVRAEEALRHALDRLHHLSRRLLEVQEDERRHIARELHDEFGQLLATITLHLHAARSAAGEAAQASLAECMGLLRQAGEQVRTLALQLRPTMLETAGLEATLRWLAEQHQQRTGVVTQVEGHLNSVPVDLAIACFRIVQEALTNVVRHARAQHVSIELCQREDVLELAILDDGVGFDVNRTFEEAAGRGRLGLLGMRERVQILGGSLEVDSQPDRGTRIRVSVPLAGAAGEAERGA